MMDSTQASEPRPGALRFVRPGAVHEGFTNGTILEPRLPNLEQTETQEGPSTLELSVDVKQACGEANRSPKRGIHLAAAKARKPNQGPGGQSATKRSLQLQASS